MPREDIYLSASSRERWMQGQLITNLHYDRYDFLEKKRARTTFPYAFLVSQDCDLERDFDHFTENKSWECAGILFVPAYDVASRASLVNSATWGRAKKRTTMIASMFFPRESAKK